MNTKSPPAISAGVSKSDALVKTVADVLTYIPLFSVAPSFLTRTLSSVEILIPSNVLKVPEDVVNVAPTPAVPLL